MVILVDFDATVVEHRYPDVGEAAPGAFFWLKRFQELDAKLVLYTMRDGKELVDAVEFCKQNGVEFWAHNDNPSQKYWTTSRKVYGHVVIDDTAAGCPMTPHPKSGLSVVDWAVVGPLVEKTILAKRKMLPLAADD